MPEHLMPSNLTSKPAAPDAAVGPTPTYRAQIGGIHPASTHDSQRECHVTDPHCLYPDCNCALSPQPQGTEEAVQIIEQVLAEFPTRDFHDAELDAARRRDAARAIIARLTGSAK